MGRLLVNSSHPLGVKDAEDWFIKSAQEESLAEEYRLLKKGRVSQVAAS